MMIPESAEDCMVSTGFASVDPGHNAIRSAAGKGERELQLKLAEFSPAVETACRELAPHKICQYVYELADVFNAFYHETKILSEEDPERKHSYIALITLAGRVLSQCIGLLGFSAPERM